MKLRTVTAAVLAVGLASTMAACSSSTTTTPSASASASASSSPAKALKVTWTFTGPENDGGYNTINEVAMNAMTSVPGVTINPIYNVPYTDQASQILTQAIAAGTNVIVDTIGLGSLLTDVCKKHPDVICYSGADATAQPANSVSWWLPDWHLGYVAGVAAGLMTKTHTVGMVVPYSIPIANQAINTFTLGCQSVDPTCKVKVIFTDNYFDPTAATRAATTLVNAGADVLRNITDDPSFCKVAAAKHVYAVGEYNDFSSACADSIITSTVWDFSDFMKAQALAIQAGTVTGSGTTPVIVPLGTAAGSPHLGAFGAFVPADVQTKIQDVYNQIQGGKSFLVGPITDQKGVVKVPAGTTLDDKFLFEGWTWFVKGVTTTGK